MGKWGFVFSVGVFTASILKLWLSIKYELFNVLGDEFFIMCA